MIKWIVLLISVLVMSQVHELTGFFFDLVPTKMVKHPIKQKVLRNPYVADGQKKYHINQKRPFEVLNTVYTLKQDLIKTILQKGGLSVDFKLQHSTASSYKVTPTLDTNSNNKQKGKPSADYGELTTEKYPTNSNTEKDNKLPTTITSNSTEVPAVTDQTTENHIPSGEISSETHHANPNTEKDNNLPKTITSISTEIPAVTDQTTDNHIQSGELSSETHHANPNTEKDNNLTKTITSISTEVPGVTDQTTDNHITSGELSSETHHANSKTEKDNNLPTTITSISTEILAVTLQTTDNHIPSNENDVKEETNLYNEFKYAAAKMDRDYYLTTFRVLLSNCPERRKRNGISFVVSGVWLHMLLLLLSSEVEPETRAQLDRATHFTKTSEEKDLAIKTTIEGLPPSSEDLKLRWSNRLILDTQVKISDAFIARGQEVLGLKVDFVDGKNTTQLITTLNEMVHRDTRGMLRGSFQDKDFSGSDVRALLLNTIYLRSRWRGAVTLLNGTTDFHHAPDPPYQQTRMFRINDIMGYADLPEWDAEVVEIPYTTAYLSLLVVAPRSVTGIRSVADRVMEAGVGWLVSRLRKRRVAVSLPQYTLRMTVLLPNKLQQMGMPGLIGDMKDADADAGRLRLSHGIQKIMFWAKAGRHAFKDDGVEWDPRPDLKLLLDRPYVFMVRWHDLILIMGNFVH